MGAVTQVCIGLAIAVLLVAAAFVLAWLKSPAWMKTPAAPRPAHPASRALAARNAWDGEGDDQYSGAAPVAEVEPPCTRPPGWHAGTSPAPTRLADRRADRVDDAGLFAFLADGMPENHKVADVFDLYCAEAEDRS